jgi:hypothetical protein
LWDRKRNRPTIVYKILKRNSVCTCCVFTLFPLPTPVVPVLRFQFP